MDASASKLDILDRFKEDDSEIEELSRIEESELLQSPRFRRFQSSSSSPKSPRSPSSSPASPHKSHRKSNSNNENYTASFESIPKLKYSGSNPFLKTPSKKRIPLKPSNRPPLKFMPSSPSKIQNDFIKPTVSLTPAQRVEKRPGRLLTTGDILSAYDFKETVGRGAFANVYRAVNKVTGDEVAIKEIFIEDDDNILELMQEIDLLKILKHKNVVKYHGFIRNEKKMLIFLEYCSGGSLRHLYKKSGPLEEKRVINLMKQVLSGLIYLHSQGVVHRDVKAANILLTSEGDVKLTDFGVSTQVSSNTIKTFSVAGTPNWMAPEIISMDGTSSASDIWSLGATVVELLTGEPLYSHLNEMAALHAIVTDEHPPIPEFISSSCKDFLMKCFEKQPKLRFTAEELLEHEWLNQTSKELRSKPSKTYQQTSELEEPVDRDFNSIKRFNTHNFLPMATGTFKHDQFDSFSTPQLTLQMKNLDINVEKLEVKEMSLFSPVSMDFEEKFNLLVNNIKENPLKKENVSDLIVFLTQNPDQLNSCANEVMIFNVLQWVEFDNLDYEVLALHLKLLNKLINVDNCGLVDLGGITQLLKYLHRKFPLNIRNNVVDIFNSLIKDELNLKVFIQSGGLKASLKLLEGNYKNERKLLIFLVSLLVKSFSSSKISKSTVLLIISSHKNLLDWLAVVLLQFVNHNDFKSSDKLISVICELKGSPLFLVKPIFLNSVYKVYDKLSLKNQVTIVDFLKTMDINSLKENSELLKFMVRVIKKSVFIQNDNSNAYNNRLLNMSCSVLFNICHLDESKQIDLVKMDVIPVFQRILRSNLTSAEFIIPLVCELAHNVRTAPVVYQEDLIADYLNLLRDPVWQANAMDSLVHLNEKIPDDTVPNLLLNDPGRSLITALLTQCGLNYELFLENLLKLLNLYNRSISVNQIRLLLFQNTSVINTLFEKVTDQYSSDIPIQINIFRLFKLLMINNYDHPNYERITKFTKNYKDSKVLMIQKLVNEILNSDNSKVRSMMPPPPRYSSNRITNSS